MFPRWRLGFWVAVLAAAGLVVVGLVWLSKRKPTPQVSVVEVTRENISASISSNGKIEPVMPYVLHALYPTFVTRVPVHEGQQVKRGELLVELDSTDIRADLARAREQLVAAQDDLRNARAGGRADEAAQINAALRKAQLDVSRLQQQHDALQRLAAKQAATKEEVAQNATALAVAQANLQEAQKKKDEFERRAGLDAERDSLSVTHAQDDIRSLEEKLSSSEARAPIDGTLYSLEVKKGDFVKVGDPLASVADLHHLRVRAFIDEPDLGTVEPNQTVEITWDGRPGERWLAQTAEVPKEVVSHGQRSVGEVLCPIADDKLELIPNINVNVLIHVQEHRNVLTVPRGAVRFEGARRYVFIVTGGLLPQTSKLQRREVKLGIASSTRFEVLDGLREGETVALPTDVELRDGMTVRVAQPE